VLVVDDDSDLIDIALAYLSEMGYGAYHTTDGETALRLLEEHEDIALMLTDIIMPGGMSGAELAQRAQELRADVRILYSSGFPADALEERSVRLADRLLLRKPYTQSEFKAMIRSVMDRE